MFKNAIIYKIFDSIDLGNLPNHLATIPASNPGALEYETNGFVAPDKERPDLLVRTVNGVQFIRLKTIQKIMPASVVKEHTDIAIANLEGHEQRKLSRKERAEVKDAVIISMLPDAFTKSTYTDAFIDYEKKLLVVNASSFAKAEVILMRMRKAIGTLPVTPLEAQKGLVYEMTSWVAHGGPFSQLGNYSLVSGDTGEKKIKLEFFEADELENIIKSGNQVVSLSLDNMELSFTLDSELRIRKIKDISESQVEFEENENHFEADCLITHGLLTRLIDQLIESLGGEVSDF